MPESNLTPKVPRSKVKHNAKRQSVSQVNEQFKKNAALTSLAEAESMASYNRKHFPRTFTQWGILDSLQQLPPVNWSEQARNLGLLQKNGGQILAKDNIGVQEENTPSKAKWRWNFNLPTTKLIMKQKQELISSAAMHPICNVQGCCKQWP